MVAVGGGALIVQGLQGSDDSGGSSTSGGPSPTRTTVDPAIALRAQRRQQLTAALTKLAPTVPEFSVAVLDRKTGERFEFKGTEKFDTASVVKASILACTLLQAQDDDRKLTTGQRQLTARSIRNSDNDATTELFGDLGKVQGLTACNKRLGLTQTAVNSAWGLTRTTADDQVRLLAEFVNPKSPLSVPSRQYAFSLMTSVQDDQDWGVPAAAKAGETATVKNGWDTRDADNGLWAVNSIGRITSADRKTDVSVAVLSHNNQTYEDGIALVEKVAKLTRQYLKY
ncbi:serine hydrolase [Paractinoplanes atraurantiacus]|uniref:Beta-lactamase class A n=1 Tax=Paractinoplanes atraurantiacus TaxID=1036182 RepID=A0A285K918_9ACTN|nr:Beta-lactamase class A [Actinoplanes atraurantiacus]